MFQFLWWLISFVLRVSFIKYVMVSSLIRHSHVLMIEMLMITIAIFLLPKKIFRVILGFPFIIISFVDLINIVITGRHLDPTTLLNLEAAQTIGNGTIFKIALFFVLFLILWLPDLFVDHKKAKGALIKILDKMHLTKGIQATEPDNITTDHSSKLKANENSQLYSSSDQQLSVDLSNQRNKHNSNSKVNFIARTIVAIVLLALVSLAIKGASYQVIRSAYIAKQFMNFEPSLSDSLHTKFYKDRVVHRKTPIVIDHKTLLFKNYNVVVIFAEGTSLKVISPDVAPNAYNFQKDCLVVKNYLNHTAATYRGLRGQMISGFQNLGGFYQKNEGLGQVKVDANNNAFKKLIKQQESLPTILNKHGYETIFYNAHQVTNNLSHIMKYVGFSEVKGNPYINKPFMTDKELYDLLWKELETKQNNNIAQQDGATNKPFFLATYVLGTHEGHDSPDLKYGDGTNQYLNKFYNQDHWFGEFLEKFKNSELSKNTILIFTTDHSSYSSKKFMETFHTTSNYFVDYIPFFIYLPNITSQNRGFEVDAHNRNSLLFAPTVLDLLGIVDEQNHFLGQSIFDDQVTNDYEKIAVIGTGYYYLDQNNQVIHFSNTHRFMKEDFPKKIFKDPISLILLIDQFLNYSG